MSKAPNMHSGKNLLSSCLPLWLNLSPHLVLALSLSLSLLIAIELVRKKRGYQARTVHSENELLYHIYAMAKNELQCDMKLCGLHLCIVIHHSKVDLWL